MGTNWTADDVKRLLGRGTSAPSSPSGKSGGWTADDVNRLLNPEPKRTKAASDITKTIGTPVVEEPKTLPYNPRETQAPTTLPMTSTGGSKRRESGATILAKNAEESKAPKWHEGWFDKGAFGDDSGNAVTDALLTIGYTPLDILVGAGKGLLGSLEGIKDFGTYGLAGLADLVGADNVASSLKEHAQKSDVEALLGGVDRYVSQYSALGDRADVVSSGLGQMAGTLGVGAAGTAAGMGKTALTALTTSLMGASSAGSGMSEAYSDNATDEEALKYGLAKGVIDAGSELIFGGMGKLVNAKGLSYGVSDLDDIIAKKLTNKISNLYLSNTVEMGVKSAAEGAEELLAGIGSAIAKKLTYMKEEDFSKIIKDENLFDQFIGAMLTSGMIQSGYIPGMQQGSLREANEAGVDFITGLAKDAQTATSLEQTETQQETPADVTVIESTEEQSTAVADIAAKDAEPRLEYDESSYAGTALTTIQNAKEKLNNSQQAKETVDYLSRISKDKGVVFNFTNNAELAERKIGFEGRVVDGFIKGNEITINLDTKRAINTIVGHEVAHAIKVNNNLGNFKQTFIRIIGQEAYNQKFKETENTYRGVDADVETEVIADLVGEYLFADKNFIDNLSVESPSLFQWLRNEIEYLVSVVKAGTKEQRALLKVQREFEKVYKKSGNRTSEDGSIHFSLRIAHTDGTIEEIDNARSLTDAQAIRYLEQAKQGILRNDTYIPVRKDTPQTIIDTLEQVNENIENRSMVMQVKKARQSMKIGVSNKYGDNVRLHGLTPGEIVEIINNLDNPTTMIYQTERYGKNGEALPNNVAVFVEYSKDGKEGVAVIEFDSSMDSKAIGTESGDTVYHTVVTVFEPDTVRDGIPFDYAEELLQNPNNIELEIIRKQPSRSATGENHPNTSSELLSNSIKTENGENVNAQSTFSLSANSQDIPTVGNYHVYGEDIRYANVPVLGRKAQEPKEIPTLRETAVEKPQKAAESGPSGTDKITLVSGINDDFSKLVGMYGTDEVRQKYQQLNAKINEYINTDNQAAFDDAIMLAVEMDGLMEGRTYTYKRKKKNSVKSQNKQTTATYPSEAMVNTLMEYSKEIYNAKNEVASKKIPVLQNVSNVAETTTDTTAEMRKRSYNDTIVKRTDLPEAIKNEFIDNPQMYEVLKNKDTQAQAESLMDSLATDDAIVQFNRLADAKNPISVPMGRILAKRLNDEGRTDMAVEVLRTMSTKLTEAGQFTQAAAIALMDSDPVMALQYVTRELDSLNRKGREKFGDKWTDFKLTEAEKEVFSKIEAGDTEAIKAAYQGIFNRIRKEYPSTMLEKITEYRRVAMLLNARTNVRNVVSNAMLLPVRWTADRVSALGQNAMHLINPEYKPTQALVVGKDAKNLAHDVWETVKETVLGDEGKYEDSTQAIKDKQVFKGSKFSQYIDNVTNGAITKVNNAMGKDISPSLMESARNLTYFLLKKGDDIFVQKNFEQRLASYIQAQGIKSIEDVPADAITLAHQEALKATFKDDTALARTLTGIKRNTGVFGEALLPFTKTPANLAMRGYDYSVGGYVDAFKTIVNKNRTQADVSSAMDSLSKSLVGTAAIFAGYLLAKSGVITGALSDDDEEKAFQQKMGMLPYAIKVGDNYYTYDWAQPASIPIILGASIYQSIEESDNFWNTWSQAGMAAVDAWFNLSPVQNLQELFGGYGSISENIAGTLADLPASLIPAQLGALTRVGDRTQRQTFSNGDFWGTRVNTIASKIPGLSQTLPASYDTWGNEIKRSDSVGEAAFAQLISPGQLGNSNVTAIDDEIMRLYDATGNNSVFPLKADWSYTINGSKVPLDNVSYSMMQQSMGESAYELAETFINSNLYGSLNDETKAKVLSDLYSFARSLAKSKLLDYDIANSNDKTLYQIYQDGGAQSVVNYKIYKLQADTNGNGSVSADEATKYFNGMNGMPRSEKAYWFDTLNGSKKNPYR